MPSPNLIKYSTSTQSTDLRKGNFYLGVSDKDYGPTNITNYYNGVTSSGYVTYIWDGVEIRYNSAANDDQLNSFYSGLDSVKNFALPLSANWPVKRSDVVEITDGSIPPPNPGARVWRCTVNTSNANTLHRMWNFGNQNGIIGNLGNYYYRYYLWCRGESTNSANCSLQMDISDGGGAAGTSQLIGTSSEWRLISLIDEPRSYNTDKFFDFSFVTPTSVTSSANGDIFYISSIHVVSINVATSSQLLSLQYLPFPGYIDYSAVKPLTFTATSQCASYALQSPNHFLVDRNYESIVTDGLRLHYDASFISSYPKIGDTIYNVGLSGSNNGSFINGATFSNNSIIFDGVNDYLALSATVSLSATSDWTIQCWIASNATQSNISYLRFLGNGSQFNFFFFEWYDRILARNSDGTGFVFFTNFTPALPLDNKPFLLNIMNRSGFLEVYSNGVKTTASATFSGTLLFRDIMRERTNTNPGGRLFSFSHYDRAISSDEVLKNYQSTLPRFYGSNIVTNGLVALLDAGYSTSFTTASNTWFDVSGYGNNGILINGPTFSSSGGGSILFDGINDSVNLGDILFTPNTNKITIDIWISFPSMSVNRIFMSKGSVADGNLFTFQSSTGSGPSGSGSSYIRFSMSNGSVSSTNIEYGNLVFNRVYNFTFTFDGSQIVAYKDASETQTQSLVGPLYYTNSPLYLSTNKYGSAAACNIYSFKVYNRPLSASEVLQNYNAQKSRYGL